MDKSPQQEAEDLLKKYGKPEALKRAAAIHTAAGMRRMVKGDPNKLKHWNEVVDIIIAADGNLYPHPNNKQGNPLK